MKIYSYGGKANVSGDRIHQARTAQRLSQDALAAKMQVAGVGIGREAISRRCPLPRSDPPPFF